jgi:hypothetical protein
MILRVSAARGLAPEGEVLARPVGVAGGGRKEVLLF